MTTIATTLTITSSGKMTANPNSVTVTQKDTTLEYSLDRASAVDWRLTGLSTTATSGQASQPVLNPEGTSISFGDANTVAQTFSVIIYFTHRTSGARHWHDPEVTNEPPV
jgi:hypothetical protein